MANQPGDPVHGEAILDGDASGGIAVTLYDGGTLTSHTLTADEVLYITDVFIASETGGDVSLCADGKVAGEYVVHGTLDAKDYLSVHFQQPRACVKATGLTFYGISTNINSCIIEGFIVKG